MAYELDDLVERGMAPVARLLITRAAQFDTATYGEARRMLESELGIDRVFSTHPGNVVGTMMNRLWEYDESLPPLNALMVNRGGTPSSGADWYISQWSGRRYSRMTDENRAPVLAEATRAVWAYKRWAEVYKEVFGAAFAPVSSHKVPVTPGEYGGAAESEEHKRLKQAVAANPALVISVSQNASVKPESRLRSGDEIDVHVIDADREYAIEVKSYRSTSADLERGIYQAVKYRAVIEAQYQALGATGSVSAVLVTETPLPDELRSAAGKLGVKTKVVSVNEQVARNG